MASQVVLVIKKKNPPDNAGEQEMQVRFLGGEDPLEEEMATHSSVLAWENPRDRGAWQTTVHGVVESRIGLKRLSTAAPVSAE